MGLSEETKKGTLWRDQQWVSVERLRMGLSEEIKNGS